MSLYSTQLLKTAATHSVSLTNTLDSALAQLSDATSAIMSWVPTSRLSRAGIMKIFAKIVHGQLTVISDGETLIFGQKESLYDRDPLRATLIVRNESFWTRLILFDDLGFAEGFMEGQVDCSDISSLLRIFLANRSLLNGLGDTLMPVISLGRKLTAYQFLGDVSTSRANISSHYDLGNTMFSNILSKDMNYSSALFLEYNEDLRLEAQPDNFSKRETLENAQLRKMKNLLNKLSIQPGDRVLEIGTGWGSLSILAATLHPTCTIDTITLSSEQAQLANVRIASHGLSDRITVHLMDFRKIKEQVGWAGAFDRFVSVEMIENVGREFTEEYWRCVDWAMKKDAVGNGPVGVVQVITMPEARIPHYDKAGVDFIQKWIFPGCYIPSLHFLISTLTSGSSNRLTVDSVTNIGPHYARTLREWKRNFEKNWNDVIVPALVEKYPELGKDAEAQGIEIFRRKWMYYFDYCESGFATRYLGDHIITFTREGNVGFGCDVDPTLVEVPSLSF